MCPPTVTETNWKWLKNYHFLTKISVKIDHGSVDRSTITRYNALLKLILKQLIVSGLLSGHSGASVTRFVELETSTGQGKAQGHSMVEQSALGNLMKNWVATWKKNLNKNCRLAVLRIGGWLNRSTVRFPSVQSRFIGSAATCHPVGLRMESIVPTFQTALVTLNVQLQLAQLHKVKLLIWSS